MGNKCAIGLLNDDNTVRAIYCGSDGYPTNMSNILNTSYNTVEAINGLLDLGDISVLGNNLYPEDGIEHSMLRPQRDTVLAYNRDAGENDCMAITYSSLEDFLNKAANVYEAEYLYVFMNGAWYFKNIGNDLDWTLLEKYLSNNEINKKKYWGKKNVKGAFQKLDAGNVEYNVSQFNKGFGNFSSDGSSAATSAGEGGGMGEALNEGDDNYVKHETHQKYKNWNNDTDSFVSDRYTPYVTTKRVKRTLEKMGYKPVEANGIMMDIQKGSQAPRHVTLETSDQGETWSFRNEKGGRMFDLEEDMIEETPYTIQGIPYNDIEDDVESLIDYTNGMRLKHPEDEFINWIVLMNFIIKYLGYSNPDEITDVAACLIHRLKENGIAIEVSEDDIFYLTD